MNEKLKKQVWAVLIDCLIDPMASDEDIRRLLKTISSFTHPTLRWSYLSLLAEMIEMYRNSKPVENVYSVESEDVADSFYDSSVSMLKLNCEYAAIDYLVYLVSKLQGKQELVEKGLRDKVFLLLRRGELSEARLIINAALQNCRCVTLGDIHAYTADIWHMLDNYELADSVGEQAIMETQEDPTSLYEARCILAHIKMHIDFRSAVEAFVSLSPLRTIDERVRAEILFNEGEAKLIYGDYVAGWNKSQESLDLSEKTGYQKGIADSLRRIAEYYVVKGLFNEAEYAAQGASKTYEKLGEIGTVWVQHTHGEVHRAQGHFSEALKSYEKGVKMARAIGNKNRIAHGLLGKAATFRLMRNPKMGLYDAAFQKYRQIGSDWGMVHTSIDRALSHLQLNEKPEFLYHLRRAADLVQQSRCFPFVREKEFIKNVRINPDPLALHPLIYS